MIFETRSNRYRGGSRWLCAGVLGVYVGFVEPAVAAVDGDINLDGQYRIALAYDGQYVPTIAADGQYIPSIAMDGEVE